MLDQVLYLVGLPALVLGAVLAIAMLLPPLRRRPVCADCALALCLPAAAALSFVLSILSDEATRAQKVEALLGGDGWQEWYITPWVLLGALVLAIAAACIGRGRWRWEVPVLAAGIGGVLLAWLLVLPGLEGLWTRLFVGLKFAIPVLVFAGVAALRRDVLFQIAAWAAAAALSMTLMASGLYTLGFAAGALAATAAVAAVVLAVAPSSAPSNRVGHGAAVGLSITLIMLLLVGKTYDLSDVSIWQWWMPFVGVPALFLLPRPAASSAKTTNPLGRRISLGLLALYVVLVPAIASMIQAAIDLSDTGSSGYG